MYGTTYDTLSYYFGLHISYTSEKNIYINSIYVTMTRFDPAVIVCYVNTIELYISSSFTMDTILLLRNDIKHYCTKKLHPHECRDNF